MFVRSRLSPTVHQDLLWLSVIPTRSRVLLSLLFLHSFFFTVGLRVRQFPTPTRTLVILTPPITLTIVTICSLFFSFCFQMRFLIHFCLFVQFLSYFFVHLCDHFQFYSVCSICRHGTNYLDFKVLSRKRRSQITNCGNNKIFHSARGHGAFRCLESHQCVCKPRS